MLIEVIMLTRIKKSASDFVEMIYSCPIEYFVNNLLIACGAFVIVVLLFGSTPGWNLLISGFFGSVLGSFINCIIRNF